MGSLPPPANQLTTENTENMKKTETHILAVALHALANDINTEDGVASSAIREAGDRLLEMDSALEEWKTMAAELALAAVAPDSKYCEEVLEKYRGRIAR